MTSTLDGITVLDFSTGSAAALASMMLSDHGARVVRVIAPGENPFRENGFAVWDRAKECLTLDLERAGHDGPEAERLNRLIAGADVLIEDFAPSSSHFDLFCIAESGLISALIFSKSRSSTMRSSNLTIDKMTPASVARTPAGDSIWVHDKRWMVSTISTQNPTVDWLNSVIIT